MQNLRQLSAPGKVVLCGEYAVLEGATASVCAIQRRAHLHWVDTPQELTPEAKACVEIAAKAFRKKKLHAKLKRGFENSYEKSGREVTREYLDSIEKELNKLDV